MRGKLNVHEIGDLVERLKRFREILELYGYENEYMSALRQSLTDALKYADAEHKRLVDNYSEKVESDIWDLKDLKKLNKV
jgi:hypothetical protein